MLSAAQSSPLLYKLRDAKPLIDGRVQQTFDIVGHPGLLIRWKGWSDGRGGLSTDVQYFELADGRRFDIDDQDSALLAWEALQPRHRLSVAQTAHFQTDADVSASRARRHIARSLIPSRLKALDDAAIPYEEVRPGQYSVYGSIDYYPATGMWRALKTNAHGYTTETLIAEARKQDHEKLAVGLAAYGAPANWPAGEEAPLPAVYPDMTALAAAPHAKRPASGTETADETLAGGEQPDREAAAVRLTESGSRAFLPRVMP